MWKLWANNASEFVRFEEQSVEIIISTLIYGCMWIYCASCSRQIVPKCRIAKQRWKRAINAIITFSIPCTQSMSGRCVCGYSCEAFESQTLFNDIIIHLNHKPYTHRAKEFERFVDWLGMCACSDGSGVMQVRDSRVGSFKLNHTNHRSLMNVNTDGEAL